MSDQSNEVKSKKYRLTALLPVVVSLVLMGCGEPEPIPPRFVYDSANDVIIKPVQVGSVRATSGAAIQDRRTVAVLTFKSPGDTQGGALISDIFSMTLRARGFQVVERDYIDRIVGEQQLATERRTALSDLEIAKRIGSISAADYILIGATTIYKSEPQMINLPIRVRDGDREEYRRSFDAFKAEYVSSWTRYIPFPGSPWPEPTERRASRLRVEKKILSLEETEEELKKIFKQEFHVIATIGVSAKLIDVRSSGLIWIGQGETVDFTLVGGGTRIIDKMLDSMQVGRSQARAAAPPNSAARNIGDIPAGGSLPAPRSVERR